MHVPPPEGGGGVRKGRLTGSVHLKVPQNMRESVVVTRKFLLRSERRKFAASSFSCSENRDADGGESGVLIFEGMVR